MSSTWLALVGVALLCCTSSARAQLTSEPREIVRVPDLLRMDAEFEPGPIVVAGDPPNAPAACDLLASVRRLDAFFQAVSNGDPELVSHYFGKGPPDFEVFSMNGPNGKHFVAQDATVLADYFQERFRQGERMELRAVQVNRWTNGMAHFGPIFAARTARDLPQSSHSVSGKGAIDCATGTVVALSLATAPVR